MGLMMCEGKYVGRDEIANVPTPTGTASWHPVAHAEVIDAVSEVVKAHRWNIVDSTGKLITIQAFAGKDLGKISYITATNGSAYWLPKGITKNTDAGWLHVGWINTTNIPRNDKVVVFTATFADGTEQVVAQT